MFGKMSWKISLSLILGNVLLTSTPGYAYSIDEETAVGLSTEFEKNLKEIHSKLTLAVMLKLDENSEKQYRNEERKYRVRVSEILGQIDWRGITNANIHRQFELYSNLGPLKLSVEYENFFESNKNYMRGRSTETKNTFYNDYLNIYFSESVKNTCDPMQRHINLQRNWLDGSKELANEVKNSISKYFKYIRRASKDVEDIVAYWSEVIGYSEGPPIGDFQNDMTNMWDNNLYQYYAELFAYMKFDVYSELRLPTSNDDPLPAYIYDIMRNHNTANLAEYYRRLKSSLGSSIKVMAETAQKFHQSLGFDNLSRTFWQQSDFRSTGNEKPYFADFFYDKEIHSMIAYGPLNYETYFSVHQYIFKIYRNIVLKESDQPEIFKGIGFRPFYDAIEGALMIAVKSHKRALDLLRTPEDYKDWFTIGTLRAEAVREFTALASARAMEAWKWSVVTENFDEENMICELWNLRLAYEGVVPLTHLELNEDPNAILDFSSTIYSFPDETGILNFTSIILKYQIFAKLCMEAGKYDPAVPLALPLHECDIYDNKAAGDYLRNLIINAAYWKWEDWLRNTFGDPSPNPESLLNYFFQTLKDVAKVNEKSQTKRGWIVNTDFCRRSDD